MTDRKQLRATREAGSAAAEPTGHDASDSRPSIWGGRRGRDRSDGGRPPFGAGDDRSSPPGEMGATMSAAVLRAREAASLEWLHSIPDDPDERQRIADDLRP